MRIKFIGAAAAVAIMASGLAMAQTPPAQTQPAPAQPAQTQPAETPPAATTAPSMIPPGPSTAPASEENATVAHNVPQHTMSACQRAIKASEKALQKSQASPDTIAQAWQHISTAKQEKGSACKEEAKQAQEML